MARHPKLQLLLLATIIACGICSLSLAQPEGAGQTAQTAQVPFAQFARQRGLEPEALARELGVPPGSDLSQPVGQIMRQHQIGQERMQEAVKRLDPIAAEAASKNWQKIRLKFALWILFFVAAMVLLVRTRIKPWVRLTALVVVPLVFGVWLGVEPNAPGTVKDGMVMLGETGAIFRPRLVAFLAFMLMSIIGNKVFCGWACQFGTLQDLFAQVKTHKWKPPFALSNGIRVSFFAGLAVTALGMGRDILEPIDPFRIFRLGAPIAVGVAIAMLVAGLFVYRPWCNFFCPFGLISWLGERLSLARVRINHNTCINCRACERACGTHSMEQLRAKKAFAQDCFACGACLRVCPVTALRWGLKPPPDKAEHPREAAADSDQV